MTDQDGAAMAAIHRAVMERVRHTLPVSLRERELIAQTIERDMAALIGADRG